MGMVQIVTAKDVANASIIKGFLESAGIAATYGPNFSGYVGHVPSCIVFAPEEKAEEALKLLKEQGLI